MKKISRILLFFLLPVLLSGCFRMATFPTVDLSHFTPEVEFTESPEEKNELANTSTPELDSITLQSLQTYPLWVGSSWVYEYLGFDQEQEVTWRVVETVVETQRVQGYYAARVERTVELQDGSPGTDFPAAPEGGIFWLVLVDNLLYRSDSMDDFKPDTAWLELIIPFSGEGNLSWYPDPGIRMSNEQQDMGARTSSMPFTQGLPLGGSYTCYNLSTRYVDGASEDVFCDGVGFVYLEYTHEGHAYGFKIELTGFSLQ